MIVHELKERLSDHELAILRSIDALAELDWQVDSLSSPSLS